MSKKLLVVVDIQNDFIDGSLGTKEAQAIVPNVIKKIYEWDGDIISSYDTHDADYMETSEGKKLPVVHCVYGTHGWEQNDDVIKAIGTKHLSGRFFKNSFGSIQLGNYIQTENYNHIEFIGLCTDICVISNVLITKAYVPEATIIVDASCCAGVTPASHKNALEAMKMCQIDIINEPEESE